MCILLLIWCFFFSSRRRHTRWTGDWSSDVCSSDLAHADPGAVRRRRRGIPARQIPRRRTGGAAGLLRLFLPADRLTPGRPDRSEERRVGKSVDLGGRRIIKKKRHKKN